MRVLFIICMYLYIGFISINWVDDRGHMCPGIDATNQLVVLSIWPVWLGNEMSHNDNETTIHECLL